MKIRISLLVAYLAIVGIAQPIEAEIIKNASPLQASTRVKNLEAILRQSGICKHYPNVVKIVNNNTIQVATYAQRQLSDNEIKLLAINIAKLLVTNANSSNVNKIVGVKVRLYDPASTKYWKDIVLSAAQIQGDLKSGPEQEQILSSIKIINNLGLVDGPNLESRIAAYQDILKLKHSGVNVHPYLAKLSQIETAEKNKRSIKAQLADLYTALASVESTINKPIASNIKTNEIEGPLKQSWQDACDNEATALKAVEEAEQEQKDLMLPEAHDFDAQARYQSHYEGLQQKIDNALAAWHEASRYRDLAYQELMQAKEHY